MTLTFEADLDMVKYLGHIAFSSNVIVRTHSGYIAIPEPLK